MLKNNLLNKKDLEILKKNYKIEGLCPREYRKSCVNKFFRDKI